MSVELFNGQLTKVKKRKNQILPCGKPKPTISIDKTKRKIFCRKQSWAFLGKI